MTHSIFLNANAYNQYAQTSCSCGWESKRFSYSNGRNRAACDLARSEASTHLNVIRHAPKMGA
jgi:hypothetical protein